MIKGAIFDMDGTLLDSMPVWEHASEHYLEQRGIKVKERLSDVLFTMSMQQGAAYVKEKYGLKEDIDTLVEAVNHIVFAAYENDVQPKAGVAAFLERLDEERLPMAVATSTDRRMAEIALRRTGLERYFKAVFTCSEIGKGKREPDIYHAAARCLGTAPEETWVFEDALYAAKTAKAAGYRTFGVYDKQSENDTEEMKKTVEIYRENLYEAEEILSRIRKA